MSPRRISLCILLTTLLCGCTTTALRRNAFNQSKTVSDFLADQVLYNLALYDKYYCGHTNFNGIPSFIRLSTGQAQVQQSVSGQLAVKIPINGGDEIDPQISGTHQTQDNWAFVPVVDPGEISRLYYLYRSQFKEIKPQELTEIFPTSPPALDQQGRPILDYFPQLNNDGTVSMTNNQPVFNARPKKPTPPKLSNVPGSLENGQRNAGWWSFSKPDDCSSSYFAGCYLDRSIWITNRENFFKFTLLTLGPTNNLAAPSSSPYLSIQNGLFIPLR